MRGSPCARLAAARDAPLIATTAGAHEPFAGRNGGCRAEVDTRLVRTYAGGSSGALSYSATGSGNSKYRRSLARASSR
jgi:hypothetical protein